jgi:hypothetical protein
MRFEARVRDEPGQLWGVWDAEDGEWCETLLGTTEEDDARRSAEMLNAMQVRLGLAVSVAVRRPPRVRWYHPAMLALAFGAFGGISMSDDNAGIVGFAVVGMLLLIPCWWKLVQMRSWTPDVHVHGGVMPVDNDHEEG